MNEMMNLPCLVRVTLLEGKPVSPGKAPLFTFDALSCNAGGATLDAVGPTLQAF